MWLLIKNHVAKALKINSRLLSPWTKQPGKVLFDHLPKCGGSSLNVYLESQYENEKTYSTNPKNLQDSIEHFQNISITKRHAYDLVKGHAAHKLINYVHPEALKVTVLRDPVDRFVSLYFYAKRRPSHYLYPKIHDYGMTLDDFAGSGLGGELKNWYTAHFSGIGINEVKNNARDSVAQAVDFLLGQYDVIGFIDDYSSLLERLQKQAKLKKPKGIRRRNVTENRPSVSDIPKRTLKKIHDENSLDIEFYKRIQKALR